MKKNIIFVLLIILVPVIVIVGILYINSQRAENRESAILKLIEVLKLAEGDKNIDTNKAINEFSETMRKNKPLLEFDKKRNSAFLYISDDDLKKIKEEDEECERYSQQVADYSYDGDFWSAFWSAMDYLDAQCDKKFQ